MMNYEAARNFLIQQGDPDESDVDALLVRLSRGYPPTPEQITITLLALNIAFEALRGTDILERQFAHALHRLVTESHHQYQLGQARGIEWPSSLGTELSHIAVAVQNVFSGKMKG